MFILTENLHGGDGLAAPAHAVLRGAHIVPGLLPGHRVKHQLFPGEVKVKSWTDLCVSIPISHLLTMG